MNEALAQNKFFKAWRITERVTRITGLAMECCYLIEGEERALLIDGLTGVGSLRAFVRELTELPVTAALTHAHMDHSGIAWESDSVYPTGIVCGLWGILWGSLLIQNRNLVSKNV